MIVPASAVPAPGGGDPWRDYRVWSIDVYRGPSPFELAPTAEGPALDAKDVGDRDALFVADPFLLRRDQGWSMYFEVLPRDTRRGVIGLATSPDAVTWRYERIVLEERFHLSYPQVFTHGEDVLMLPESVADGRLRLYRESRPGGGFEPLFDFLPGQWADPSILHHAGRWWLWACATPFQNRSLHLFWADDLFGPWHEHPRSPVVPDDRTRARPAGRARVAHGRPVRFAQDCTPRYGTSVRAFEITTLTTTRYAERERPESPVLRPGRQPWNANGMHHLDPHRLEDGTWLACVDGDRYLFP